MTPAPAAATIDRMAPQTLAPTAAPAARASDASLVLRLVAGIVLVLATLGGAPLAWLVSIFAAASCGTDPSIMDTWHCSESGQAMSMLALPVGGLTAITLAAVGMALSRRRSPAPTVLIASAWVVLAAAALLSLPVPL